MKQTGFDADRLFDAGRFRRHVLMIAAAGRFRPIRRASNSLRGGKPSRCCQLQLDALWQLYLCVGGEIIEARLAGRFLLEVLAHFLESRLVGQPREQRIILSRPVLFQILKPCKE